MLTSGDIVDLDLGLPEGREAGFVRPAVVVTAQRILDQAPSIVQVVPLTSTVRTFGAEVRIDPDEENGLHEPSAAQCQHVRAIAASRVRGVRGNTGSVPLAQVREVLALLFDLAAG